MKLWITCGRVYLAAKATMALAVGLEQAKVLNASFLAAKTPPVLTFIIASHTVNIVTM